MELTTTDADPNVLKDLETANWMKFQLQDELVLLSRHYITIQAKIRLRGGNAIPLPVKNVATAKEDGLLINRAVLLSSTW